MPRRQKPPGLAKWTWDEINQGRRWTGNEKKWRTRGKQSGWEKKADGSYQMPPEAAFIYIGTIIVIIVIWVAFGLK